LHCCFIFTAKYYGRCWRQVCTLTDSKTKREWVIIFLKKINMKNFNQGIDTFNKAVQAFGDSMDTMTKELSSDIEKSNKELKAREKKNKENLEKIWGKRK